jgi:hypothetical protein
VFAINPLSPPFCKGGLGGFPGFSLPRKSHFLRPRSRKKRRSFAGSTRLPAFYYYYVKYYESLKMTLLHMGQMPMYNIKHRWINRRTAGKVNPEVFFLAYPFQHQKSIGEGN